MKRIQDTSTIVHERRARTPRSCATQDRVLADLKELTNLIGKPPTSGELFEYLVGHGRAFNVNSVRPALTWLKDDGKVKNPGKRECAYSGVTCYTWEACA